MRNLVKTAVGRPVSTLMVFAALVTLGVFGGLNLPLSEVPEVPLSKMVVSTPFPGLAAGEVRTLVTLPLESALASVRGVKHLESVSREGASAITLEFQWGTDLRSAVAEVRQTLESFGAVLPNGAGRPRVIPVDPSDEPLAVVGVVPRDGNLRATRRWVSLELRTKLQQVPGVGTVVLVGGTDEEIQVTVDRRNLQARSLTLEDLARQVGAAVCDLPAGSLTEPGVDVPVKISGFPGTPRVLATLPILGTGGPPVELGTLATVSPGDGVVKSSFSRSGTEGIGLYVHLQPGAHPLETMDGVRNVVRALALADGGTWDITLEFDGTVPVRQGLRALGTDVGLGVLAALLVLGLFVRDRAGTLAVLVSVPVSMVLTLGFLYLTGRSLNLLSVGGIALSLGAMVDHAVVVVENLHRRVGEVPGAKDSRGVSKATLELSLTNIGSTGTSVIVFLPVMFLPGPVGALFFDLSTAVIGAHLMSFFVSVTLVPAVYLLVPRSPVPPGTRWVFRIRRGYLRGLSMTFRKPWLLVVGLAAVTLAGGGALRCLTFTPFPLVDEGFLDLDLALLPGTSGPRTGLVARQLESRLGSFPGVLRVYSRSGAEDDDPYFYGDPGERPETVHCRILLVPGERPSAFQLRAFIQDSLGEVPGILSVRVPPSPLSRLWGAVSPGYELLVTGPGGGDPRPLAEKVAGLGRGTVYPGETGTELKFVPDPAKAHRLGVGLPEVAEALKFGSEGLVASRGTSPGNDLPIRVRYADEDRDSPGALGESPVRATDGTLVPVMAFGRWEEVSAGALFYRFDRKDACLVRFPGPTEAPVDGDRVRDLAEEDISTLNWSVLTTFCLVLVLIYLFLGTQLGSFLLPLFVMCPIPLSFSGTTLALVLGGGQAGIPHLLGVIALCGLVINNSILLYQVYRDRGRSSGLPGAGVVFGGCRERFRPLVMTASITVLSLAPVAFDPQGTPESGMALALLGGLGVSSALTLFVMPLGFYAWFRRPQ